MKPLQHVTLRAGRGFARELGWEASALSPAPRGLGGEARAHLQDVPRHGAQLRGHWRPRRQASRERHALWREFRLPSGREWHAAVPRCAASGEREARAAAPFRMRFTPRRSIARIRGAKGGSLRATRPPTLGQRVNECRALAQGSGSGKIRRGNLRSSRDPACLRAGPAAAPLLGSHLTHPCFGVCWRKQKPSLSPSLQTRKRSGEISSSRTGPRLRVSGEAACCRGRWRGRPSSGACTAGARCGRRRVARRSARPTLPPPPPGGPAGQARRRRRHEPGRVAAEVDLPRARALLDGLLVPRGCARGQRCARIPDRLAAAAGDARACVRACARRGCPWPDLRTHPPPRAGLTVPFAVKWAVESSRTPEPKQPPTTREVRARGRPPAWFAGPWEPGRANPAQAHGLLCAAPPTTSRRCRT
jgi:hypothetical protein